MRQRLLKWILFVSLAILSLGVWCPVSFTVTANVTSERPFTARILWCNDSTETFTFNRSRTCKIQDGSSKLEIQIPCRQIAKFRFDFGNKPGQVKITNLALIGETHFKFASDGFAYSKGIQEHRVEDSDSISIRSDEGAPFICYKHLLDLQGRFSLSHLWSMFPLILMWLFFLFIISSVASRLITSLVHRTSLFWKDGMPSICNNERIVSLDWVRVLAFLLVVFDHVLDQMHTEALPQSLSVHEFGWGKLGVSLFFALSGASLSIGSIRGKSILEFYHRRLSAILPSFWVAYFVCLMIFFCTQGQMHLGGGWLKAMPTLFGVDGYFSSHFPLCYLVGEWYLGCLILTYLLAPAINWCVERFPVSTIILGLAISAISSEFTPAMSRYVPFFHAIPRFNILTHLVEFAFGMAFFKFIRPYFRRYIATSGIMLAYLITYLLLVKSPFFAYAWQDILASLSVFVLLCITFDLIPTNSIISETVEFIAKLSFLAFLYHHRIIYWAIKPDDESSGQKVIYEMILIMTSSLVFAYVSLKPVNAVRRIVFGDIPSPKKSL